MEYYNNKKYGLAIPIFETNNPDSSTLINLYLSISYIKTGNPDKAIANLETTLNNSKNDNIMSATRWYLILAYLSKDDISSARKELKSYLNHNYPYNQDKALLLFKELNQ
jgi:Tfp pilus assembly protein PilF